MRLKSLKKYLIFLFLLLPTMMCADIITEKQAQIIAEHFFNINQRKVKSKSDGALKLNMIWNGEDKYSRASTVPAFFVYNNLSENGFVIVSGDECTADVILGYSFDHHFDASNMPYNLSYWMSGIRNEINAARTSNNYSIDRKNSSTFDINDRQPVKLLKTALWDQGAPYNSKLPLGFVTGCPATAISIIMRYHEWPQNGVGTIPSSNEKIGQVKLGHTYDWNNMPLTYDSGSSEKQKEQVGILMRDVGAMIRTQYGQGSAGSNPEEILPQVMPIYMRYNAKTIKSLFKKNFQEEEWHAILENEINENRPILYGGYSSGGGHQFIIDGYAQNHFYHVNWGWSGVSNGYYLLSIMNPPEQGTGGSSSVDGFTRKQDAIIGIQPDETNPGGGDFDLISYKPYVPDNEVAYGIFSKVKDYQQGVEFEVTLKDFQNKGSRAFKGKLAVAHYASDGTPKGNISLKEVNYHQYPQQVNDFTEATFQCKITQPIIAGDYICGVFKHENPAEWTPIRNGYLFNNNCIERIVIKEEITSYNIHTSSSANFTDRALATFSSDYPTTPSHKEVEAYWAKQHDDVIVLQKIQENSEKLVIPAHTGVILSTPQSMDFQMNITEEIPPTISRSNALRATGDSEIIVDKNVNAYILSKKNEQLLFYRLSNTNRKIAPNRAYLELDPNNAINNVKFVFDKITGVDNIKISGLKENKIYDLMGRQISDPKKKGIYIRNGKKIIIK